MNPDRKSIVGLSVRPSEWAAFKLAADIDGMSVSAWLVEAGMMRIAERERLAESLTETEEKTT